MRNAITLAYSEAGTDLQVQFFDTLGTPTGAQAAASRAKAFDPGLVLGPLFGANVAPVRAGLGQDGPALLAFSNDISKANQKDFIFGLTPANATERILQYAAEQNKNNIAILYPQTEFGRAAVTRALNLAPTLGLRIILAEAYTPGPGQAAITSRQRAAANVGAVHNRIDALFIPDRSGALREIAALAVSNNLDPRENTYLGTHQMDDVALLSEPSLRGATFSAPADSLFQFEAEFADRYGTDPRPVSVSAYDAMILVVQLYNYIWPRL